MKKNTRIILSVLLAILVVLCVILISLRYSGTRDQVPQQVPAEVPPLASPVPSSKPTEAPEAEGDPATVCAGNVGAICALLDRGSTVNVIGEYGDWYTVTLSDNRTVYVEKRLIRLEDEPSFSEYTGYTLWDAKLYDNPYLENEPLKPKMNEELRVLDTLGNMLVVSYGGEIYCVRSDKISHDPYYYEPRGNTGGTSDSPSDSGGVEESSGADGEEIVLAAGGDYTCFLTKLSASSSQRNMAKTVGSVRMNKTEACIDVFDRDEIVQVTKWANDVCLVTTKDGIGTISASLLRPSSILPIEYTGASARGECRFYSDYRMLSEPKILSDGTRLTVLDDIGGKYVVSLNGKLGYMPSDDVYIPTIRDSDSNISPNGEQTDSGGGQTDSGGGQTDPGGGQTDPGGGQTDPGGGQTDPGGGQSDPGSGQSDPGSGEWTPAAL